MSVVWLPHPPTNGRFSLLAAAAVLGCTGLLCGQKADRRVSPGPAATERVKNFTLKDSSGRVHTPAEWKHHEAVVLFFLGTECPVSNGYAPEMTRLARAYGTRRVLFLGVHPDPDVSPAEAAKHAREYSLGMKVLLDPAQLLARQAGVRVTPEAVVLSPAGDVLYRGRIDDKYATDGKRRLEVTTRDLEQALHAVLARKKVPVPRTKAFGCPLPSPVKP